MTHTIRRYPILPWRNILGWLLNLGMKRRKRAGQTLTIRHKPIVIVLSLEALPQAVMGLFATAHEYAHLYHPEFTEAQCDEWANRILSTRVLAEGEKFSSTKKQKKKIQ